MLENLESEYKDGKMHFYMWNDVSLELLDFTFNEAVGYAENLQEAKRKLADLVKKRKEEQHGL